MQKIIAFAKRKPILFVIIAGALATCLCLAVAVATSPSETDSPTQNAAADTSIPDAKEQAPTNTKAPTNTPAPTKTPAPTRTPRPTNTPTAIPEPVTYEGSGDSVVDVAYSWTGGALAEIEYTGGSNFIVTNYDENNERIDLLVNTIGNYKGHTLVDAMEGEGPTRRLEIQASGTWKVTFYPLEIEYLHQCSVPGSCEGDGDDVILLIGAPDTGKVDYPGDRNFIVYGFSDRRDLLVNEIGPYSGVFLFPGNTFLIQVVADGAWSIEVTSR
jgi:hypothetical protein